MNPKVSVIIPVYNSSKYIARCCHSLFKQSLDSIQYIFIDDGSTDDSVSIIKKVSVLYPTRQNQVDFISYRANKGVGVARNAGYKKATGDYVIHCDSDDWVEPDLYEKLYLKAKNTGADIVNCGYKVDSADGVTISKTTPLVQTTPLLFSISPQTGALWIKMIRRDFLEKNKLNIPVDINWGEDLCLSLKALLLSQNTQYIDELLYHHVLNDESLTYVVSKAQCLELIKCGPVIEDFLIEQSLLGKYKFQLNWLKFQLKQYFLMFPQTRDFEQWKILFTESHNDVFKYQSPFYLKLSAYLIIKHLDSLALFILKIRDFFSSLKSK